MSTLRKPLYFRNCERDKVMSKFVLFCSAKEPAGGTQTKHRRAAQIKPNPSSKAALLSTANINKKLKEINQISIINHHLIRTYMKKAIKCQVINL